MSFYFTEMINDAGRKILLVADTLTQMHTRVHCRQKLGYKIVVPVATSTGLTVEIT